jgi:hypothetical protein
LVGLTVLASLTSDTADGRTTLSSSEPWRLFVRDDLCECLEEVECLLCLLVELCASLCLLADVCLLADECLLADVCLLTVLLASLCFSVCLVAAERATDAAETWVRREDPICEMLSLGATVSASMSMMRPDSEE